ncbi:MAG: type II secretion system GspH family protein [Helicobacter sp.]|nr:type II secretion system GspH family protein [Helicobacter sp.]
MKKFSAFSLIEVLIVALIVGVMLGISAKSILAIYGDYQSSRRKYLLEISLLNTIAQIQRILQKAVFESILLHNDTLEFLEKNNQWVRVGAYSLPCFSSLVAKAEMTNILKLEVLPLNQQFQANLNALCTLYAQPLELLFLYPNSSPKDCYTPKFRAKILSQNSYEIHTQIPEFLRNNSSKTFFSKVYLLDPNRAHKKIILKDNQLFLLSDKSYLLDDFIESMELERIEFGFKLTLCKKPKDLLCKSHIILEDSF